MASNLKIIKYLSTKLAPDCEIIKLNDSTRFDIVNYLSNPTNNRGLELGVAAGSFSKEMIGCNKFSTYIGIDAYLGVHKKEYLEALQVYGLESKHKIIKGEFDQFHELFEDKYFDFIYFDGFAHTGQDAGKTIKDYLPKLKKGGILAGDDYSDRWPLTKWLVLELSKQLNAQLYITQKIGMMAYSEHPSWFMIVQSHDVDVKFTKLFLILCYFEKQRIAFLRKIYIFPRIIKKLISK